MSKPNVKLISGATDDRMAQTVERFIGAEFPAVSTGTVEDVMEAVMTGFIGTKNNRRGPRPRPESEVMMRDVVRRAVAAKLPIPVLIPSAAIKVPVGKNRIDVAELSALRMLECLQSCVQRHYEPGLAVRMRMEDLTELILSGTGSDVRSALADYMGTFSALSRVLGMGSWLTMMPESVLVPEETFLGRAKEVELVLNGYLEGTRSFSEAEKAGLKWPITPEMRQYLIERYEVLYPGYARERHVATAAAYFSAIVARRLLKASGAFDGGQLEISFAPEMPDSPLSSTRLLYRTVPRSTSTFHAAYWNAKGLLRIPPQGEPRITLAHGEVEATSATLEFSNDVVKAVIGADYVLEE